MSLPPGLPKAVECPVCLRIPREGPMNQCDNGHLLCSSCYPKLTSCPVCRCFLRTPAVRCLLADLVIEFVPKTCKFQVHGCEFIISKDNVKHEALCPFREVQCPLGSCPIKISLPKVGDHTTNMHKSIISTGNIRWIVTSKNFSATDIRIWYWIPVLKNVDGRQFFICLIRLPSKTMWKILVNFAGSANEAKNYLFKVSLKSPSGDELNHTGRINSLDTPIRDAINDGPGLTFCDAMAKVFLLDERISPEVTILKANNIQGTADASSDSSESGEKNSDVG